MQFDARTREKLAEGALKAAEAAPWRDVTIHEIAKGAGVELADIAQATPGDALDAVDWLLDREIAVGLDPVDAHSLVRDRLFDLIMRRFEAMEERRAAVLGLDGHADWDPAARAAQHARRVRSARWILALARLEADGVTGAARAQGLAVILTQAHGAWRLDVNGDFVRTMATLDKSLRQAEQTFGRFAGFSQQSKREDAPANAPVALPIDQAG